MAKRNRNMAYERSHEISFPHEELDWANVPQDLMEQGYAWKWYNASDPDRPKMRFFRVNDPDLDANGEKNLVQCGALVQLRYRIPLTSDVERNPERQFTLPPPAGKWSYLMFDKDDRDQRLYSVLTNRARDYIRNTLYNENPFQAAKLSELARHTGGRHARGWYPDVMAKPVGLVAAVIYDGDKRTDGRSNYIHRFGEETGIRPLMCADSKGGLWFAGGDYTCPTAGITN
jgi:hypothetical protein